MGVGAGVHNQVGIGAAPIRAAVARDSSIHRASAIGPPASGVTRLAIRSAGLRRARVRSKPLEMQSSAAAGGQAQGDQHSVGPGLLPRPAKDHLPRITLVRGPPVGPAASRPAARYLPVVPLTPAFEHPWELTVQQARELQQSLRPKVETRDRLGPVRLVAGVDISYDRGSPVLFASVVVLDAETLEVVEQVGVLDQARFPYVPGYLSFRELPAVVRAFERLACTPDLVVCDGHGFAHPRRFGLASHLGVLFDVPSIGCGKTVLVGDHAEPAKSRGSHRRLVHEGETIGEALRTRRGVKPVFVSIGHRISVQTARCWVLRLAPRYRLPETTRAAHREVNRLRREDNALRAPS